MRATETSGAQVLEERGDHFDLDRLENMRWRLGGIPRDRRTSIRVRQIVSLVVQAYEDYLHTSYSISETNTHGPFNISHLALEAPYPIVPYCVIHDLVDRRMSLRREAQSNLQDDAGHDKTAPSKPIAPQTAAPSCQRTVYMPCVGGAESSQLSIQKLMASVQTSEYCDFQQLWAATRHSKQAETPLSYLRVVASSGTPYQPQAKKAQESKRAPRIQPGERRCSNCNTSDTPSWRFGEESSLLCNACALYQSVRGSKRPAAFFDAPVRRRQRQPRLPDVEGGRLPRQRRSRAKKPRVSEPEWPDAIPDQPMEQIEPYNIAQQGIGM